MKKKIIKNTIIAGTLCAVIVAPTFAEVGSTGLTKSTDKIIPISYTAPHWAEEYVQKIINAYDVASIFENKDLNALISAEDFQKLVSLSIDKDYSNVLKSMTREEVVNELVHIWAKETGNEVDQIPTIKMIVYGDMDKITPEYNHSITVAYMKGIASGRGLGLFVPKAKVTYGEAATMITKLETAIEVEKNLKAPEALEGIFETVGKYEVKDGNMNFNFELKNNSKEDKNLQFGSGMQFEIVVENEKGEEVYRYSDGKAFTMALVHKDIEAGGSIKWEDSWNMKDKEGKELSEGKYTATIKVLPILDEGQTINEDDFMLVLEFEI